MKNLKVILCAMLMIFSLVGLADALLVDNQDGSITQTRNDGSMLMWLQDANYAQTSGFDLDGKMTWFEARDWIQSLNDNNFLGYNDWRLPDIQPANGTVFNEVRGYDGTNDRGYNITRPSSEMSYLYYVELGNLAPVDTSNNSQSRWGLINKGLFNNIQTSQLYWSGTENPASPENAWDYFFDRGDQGMSSKGGTEHVWLVRDVNPVPEPTTMLLLGSGLIGLLGFRRKYRQ